MLSLAQLQLMAPTWMNTSSDIFNDEQAHKVEPDLMHLKYCFSCMLHVTVFDYCSKLIHNQPSTAAH